MGQELTPSDELHPPGPTRDLGRLLFNYLRISPSYRLASLRAESRIRRRMPEHSKAALLCYRRYGDVWSCGFEHWPGAAQVVSGNPTRKVQALPADAPYSPRQHENVTLVVVPNELEPAVKIEQFCGILQHDERREHLCVRPKTLWKNLAAVYTKARYPDLELWRVGVLAGSVERYQGRIDPWCERKLARDSAERRHLTLIVIRLLKNALVIAENAAVGAFPNPSPQPWQQLAFPFADHELDALLMASQGDEHLVVRNRLGLPCWDQTHDA